MFDIESLKKHISGLMDEERFKHSVGVMELSACLAEIYGIDVKKAQTAGLVHDAAKQLPEAEQFSLLEKAFAGREPDRIVFNNKKLWHGPAGAMYVKEKFDMDDQITSAVFYHTTGKENMTLLEKIIFLADCIEVNRDKEFDWAFDTREIAKKDLDEAILIAVDKSLKSIIDRKLIIHPGSVMLRNEILRTKAAADAAEWRKNERR
ncbi:MAG: bis(5'-nucleosyl)-tetraphosphatase (symmetrical) YqeK [Clostridia bacterium]|nr:bis(5'-nucleosyl)-tetraphosphatase (symmetrical) YqeK [Clostridia bacterium]